MKHRRALALLTGLALAACGAACSDSEATSSAAEPDASVANTCADGFAPDVSGTEGADGTCAPILAASCPAGSRPALGHADCQPVGWQACSEGFAPDPSGWGCAPILPPAACSGATREILGQTSCAPIGDCNAAFPPANATIFVRAGGIVDATHFTSIADAVAVAPAGAVIAVDDGVYPDALTVTKSVTIHGRCAERVVLDGQTTATRAGIVTSGVGVTIRGLTIRGWSTGVNAWKGASTFEDVLIDHNTHIGVSLADDVTTRLVRSVVRDTYADAEGYGYGLQIIFGAEAELLESVVSQNQGAGILAGEPKTNVRVEKSVVRDNESDAKRTFGLGLNVTNGAAATVARSAFLRNRRAGLRAGPKSKLTIEDVVIAGTRGEARATADDASTVGMGFFALEGAVVTATRVAVTTSEGPAVAAVSNAKIDLTQATLRATKGDADGDLANGIYALEKGKVHVVDAAIVDNGRSGIDVFDKGTEVTVERSLVADTRPSVNDKMGIGIAVAFNGSARVLDTTILGNRHSGIYVFENGSLDVAGTVVRATKKEIFEDRLGHGLLAQDAVRLFVERSVFDANVGIGVAIANSPAVLRSSSVSANAVGIHVQDAAIREADESEPTEGEVIVAPSTTFVGNTTRIGSGALVLPTPPARTGF